MAPPDVVKREIFAHMADIRAERRRVNKMSQECASKSGWSFQYDDKCGSSYLHLPAQVRESAATQNRYHYRFGLQGNLVPGVLLQYSLVPPCLRTGKLLIPTPWVTLTVFACTYIVNLCCVCVTRLPEVCMHASC